MLLPGKLLLLVLLFISWLPNSVFAQFEDEVEIPENVVTFQTRLEPENHVRENTPVLFWI